MDVIKCEICGFAMKSRLNGSHFKHKHGISIDDYINLYPSAQTGSYSVSTFQCKVCNEYVSELSAIKRKHLQSHNLSVAQYNQLYYTQKCLCGCGMNTEYSYNTNSYKQYVDGHYTAWNSGLKKSDGHPLNGGGWNRGLNKESDVRILSHSVAVKNAWSSGSYVNMVKNQQDTMIDKYGVYNYSLTDAFKIQCVSSSLSRYGVEYPMQSPEIYSKSKKGRYKFKIYTWPSGKTDEVQGYEPYALDILLELYTENEIVVKKDLMPEIWYYLKDDIKIHRYFPDIWIPTENKFIEIKSVYTWNIDKDSLYYKSKSIRESGYQFEIWIIENKKIKEIKYE